MTPQEAADAYNASMMKFIRRFNKASEKWENRDFPDGTGPSMVFMGLSPLTLASNLRGMYIRDGVPLTWSNVFLVSAFEACGQDDAEELVNSLVEVASVIIGWITAIDMARPLAQEMIFKENDD